jgi:hypothetical protein
VIPSNSTEGSHRPPLELRLWRIVCPNSLLLIWSRFVLFNLSCGLMYFTFSYTLWDLWIDTHVSGKLVAMQLSESV